MTEPASRRGRPTLVKEPLPLDRQLLLRMHDLMVESRVLEERLIQMYRQGHGYFWIGGPGEEAFNVPLGLLIKKGQGPAFDYLHVHYRQSATLLALGEDPIGALRQMKNTATDPYSGGRNFAGHFCRREWNVVPVSSPIEVQYSMAPGTAMAQKRHGGRRHHHRHRRRRGHGRGRLRHLPGLEQPARATSSPSSSSSPTTSGASRRRPPPSRDAGPSPIAARRSACAPRPSTATTRSSYLELQKAMDYVRKERKPFLLEAKVSRLYGHSSPRGRTSSPRRRTAWRVRGEARGPRRPHPRRDGRDPRAWTEEIAAKARQVRDEPQPEASTIWKHVYAEDR